MFLAAAPPPKKKRYTCLDKIGTKTVSGSGTAVSEKGISGIFFRHAQTPHLTSAFP